MGGTRRLIALYVLHVVKVVDDVRPVTVLRSPLHTRCLGYLEKWRVSMSSHRPREPRRVTEQRNGYEIVKTQGCRADLKKGQRLGRNPYVRLCI